MNSEENAKSQARERKRRTGIGLLSAVKENIAEGRTVRGSTYRLFVDLGLVALGFFLGGCHVVFGSYPLGLALLAALPSGVWLALAGTALGALTLGRAGIIYAMISVLVVFLRIVISGGGEKPREDSENENSTYASQKAEVKSLARGGLFKESLGLRISAAVIGGFISAVYEMLLEGFSLTTVSFGLAMVILPAVFALGLAGLFEAGFSVRDVLFGERQLFSCKGARGKEMFDLIFFRVSALLLIFTVSVSLKKYSLFGIDTSLLFASAVTLFVAKRFGSLYATVCGFVSSVGVSTLYSSAFALAGATAGALFSFGGTYAVIGSTALLSLFGAYAGGIQGFLSVFPEHLSASVCMLPLFRYFEREVKPADGENRSRRAMDMVGTMALSYRNRQRFATAALEEAFASLTPIIKKFDKSGSGNLVDTELAAKLMAEVRISAEQSREMDDALTGSLEEHFFACGFSGGAIRAFGGRKKYIICAGEDKDGTKITSKRLREGLEERAGVALSEPEYFRREDMVLMECEARASFFAEGGFACAAGESGEVSGDSIRLFDSPDLYSYALIADGMGSGKVAKRTSGFVCDFLSVILGTGASKASSLHMLNGILRSAEEECSVAIDLFELDRIRGECSFLKSGAASSYIKRGGSLFRIKSETVPLGLLKTVDAELIRADVTEGDFVIMISDGISGNGEDAPWLLELLGKSFPRDADVKGLADKILAEAIKNSKRRDDMSVLVLKIGKK